MVIVPQKALFAMRPKTDFKKGLLIKRLLVMNAAVIVK